ncbi:MAG: hypothetical protein WBA93_05810 [Microcoleaceae cyanobacterium]
MDDDNLDISNISMQRKKSSISLSVERDAFQEFVVSLLGKPESVEGYVEGAFEIDFGGFEQLNYIIDDRITKQNQSVLVEFRAKLFFNDNSSLSFSGINSFQEYKERRNLICTGFIFTWVYLVEFHDKKVPEKQEISVSSVEEGTPSSAKSKSRKIELTSEIFDISFVNQIPKINYSIRCTNQGWGIEISQLVRNCIIGFVKTDVPLAGFRRKAMENPIVLQIPSFILSFLLSLVFLWIYSKEGLKSCWSFSDQTGQFVGDNIPPGKKLDFLINFFNTCKVMDSKQDIILYFLAFFSVFTTLLLAQLILRLIKLPTYRFLLFTEASKKEQEKYFSKISGWRNFWLITVVVGSIFAFLNRILGNYLLEWFGNIFG